ncbi:MAG: MFS transporter [Candidatus Diapherotrites archaeon]
MSKTLETVRQAALEGEKKEEARKVRQSLSYSVKDGLAWSVMDGAGNKFITAFAVALKASNFQIGLLTSIPQLASSWVQLLSGKLLDKYKSRKKLDGWFILFQALTWIPIALIPFVWPNFAIVGLIALYTAYMAFGAIAGPIWQSWMGALVPEKIRGAYHGRRNQLVVAVGFGSTLIAGFLLNLFPAEMVFYGFALLFFIAFAARMVSRYFLMKQYDPPYEPTPGAYFSLWDYTKRLPKSNFAQFSLFIGLMNFAVNFGSPFIAVYWLKELNVSYLEFTIALLMPVIGNFVMVRYWGKLADRFGNIKILTLTGALIPFAVLYYLAYPYVQSIYWIYFVEFFSGFVWSGFNLSASNFMYDAVSPAKRAYAYSYHGIYAGTGSFAGALAGGAVIGLLPTAWFIPSVFLSIFLFSGILRFAVYFAFIKRIREVRPVEHVNDVHLIQIVATTNPVNGFLFTALDAAKKGAGEVDEVVSAFFEHLDDKVFEPVKEKVRKRARKKKGQE